VQAHLGHLVVLAACQLQQETTYTDHRARIHNTAHNAPLPHSSEHPVSDNNESKTGCPIVSRHCNLECLQCRNVLHTTLNQTNTQPLIGSEHMRTLLQTGSRCCVWSLQTSSAVVTKQHDTAPPFPAVTFPSCTPTSRGLLADRSACSLPSRQLDRQRLHAPFMLTGTFASAAVVRTDAVCMSNALACCSQSLSLGHPELPIYPLHV
jgi:hypothetical protein